MKQYGKQAICLLLSMVLLLTMLPVAAMADGTIASGTCGQNVNWTLTDTGTLIISGSGSMKNYSISEEDGEPDTPWYANRRLITKVVIEPGVTTIGEYAFHGCQNLSLVTIAETVTAIGKLAFYNCTGLTELTIPGSITTIGSAAFRRCSGLKNLTLPEGVTTIGKIAFFDCTGLQSLTIPGSVTTVGEYAFGNCTGLTTVTFRGTAPAMDNTCFKMVTAIVYYPCNDETWSGDVKQSYGGNLTWQVKHNYNDGACTDCQKAEILYSDTIYQTNLRWQLDSAGTLTISGTGPMKDFSKMEGGGYNAPWYWKNGQWLITNVVIESGVTSIGTLAFYECRNLTRVSIAESVTSIGVSAFGGCSNLRRVTLPAGVTTIGGSAFAECKRLISVTISEGVTNIGSSAFRECMSLADVTIPRSVTTIGSSAFEGCSNLTSITFLGSAPSIKESIWGNDCLEGVTAWAYHPCDDATWTEDVRQSYGGSITWVGHVFGSYVSYQDATCMQNAMGTGICEVCGTIGDIEFPGTATDHSFGADRLCETCGDPLGLDIYMEGYYYGSDWEGAAIKVYADGELVTTVSYEVGECEQATISLLPCKTYTFQWTEGWDNGYYIASSCKFMFSMNGRMVLSGDGSKYLSGETICTIESMVDHQYGKTVITPPTCTGEGYTTAVCSYCGDCHVTNTVPAIGHRYENGVCTACGDGKQQGDLDGDGERTIVDVARLYSHVQGTAILNSLSLACADVNGDKTVDIADVARLYAHVTGTSPLL